MKTLNKLIFFLFFISNPTFGKDYPIVTDQMLVPGYNRLELRYDQTLLLTAPYPKRVKMCLL